ncbi:MAG: magnesium transporter CorA family protein [Acidimicrobiales bacterium]|nr:magnesium transporter CorA family protein [Acidimicrobiales bacterium]
MKGVLTVQGSSRPATQPDVVGAFQAGQFFWLDLDGVDDDTASMLETTFGIHPLVVDAARAFHQRPKIDDADDYTAMVVYGVMGGPEDLQMAEVHFLLTAHYVISIRQGAVPAFDGVRSRISQHRASDAQSPEAVLVYLMVDQLLDTFLPVLEQFDNKIDELEDAILVKPTEAQLGTLFDMKRSLISIRRVVAPQRDMFAGVSSGIIPLTGVGDEGDRYIREIYDRLIRVSDLVDSYRDLLTGVMDTHLSTVSNRLNQVMKQLTIIATIFLPLSFLTGFFGQNFLVLVNHIRGPSAFWIFGVGLELLCVVGLLYLFHRRGWLGQAD